MAIVHSMLSVRAMNIMAATVYRMYAEWLLGSWTVSGIESISVSVLPA